MAQSKYLGPLPVRAGGFKATRSGGGGIGYSTGQGIGSTVTQTTNRATGVTINKLCGQITTDSTSLAAEASAQFIVTNDKVAAGDVVIVSPASGVVAVGTIVSVCAVGAGSFTIRVHNGNASGGTAETGAIVINFVVIKGTST